MGNTLVILDLEEFGNRVRVARFLKLTVWLLPVNKQLKILDQN
jgi:hypothetical protein